MENLYTCICPVPTSLVGIGGRIRLSSLLCLMQDAASVHASQLGLGFHDLYPQNKTFLLSRTELEICAPLPCWGDGVRLQTWPRGVERLIAYRDYELSLEGASAPFLKASTAWLMIDTVQRRPIRPQEFFVGITPRNICALSEEAPRKLAWKEGLELFETRPARPSDLDINSHVNNTRYIDWICDCVARSHGLEAGISSLCINYQGEIHPWEQVRIHLGEGPDGRIHIQGEGERRNFCASLSLSPSA